MRRLAGLFKTLFIVTVMMNNASATTSAISKQASDLIWITEEYPPYNFHDGNGKLIGISVDLLSEIMRRMDIPFSSEKVYVIPWARGYKETLANPNAALFTMTFSEYRQDLFQFVGPILPSRISVVTVNPDFNIASVNDLGDLTVGAVRNDIGEQMLNKHGLAHVAKVKLPTSLEIIRMLLLHRIDAVAIDETAARFEFDRLGISKEQFQIHLTLEELTTHFAFNVNVSPEFVAAFSATFEQLQKEGFTQQIFDKYGVSSN
jgi:polar amino acid transport system substrate-binding protein